MRLIAASVESHARCTCSGPSVTNCPACMTCWPSGANGPPGSPAADSMPATFSPRRPQTRLFRSYIGSLLDRLGDDLGVISSAERGVDLVCRLLLEKKKRRGLGDRSQLAAKE